MPSGAVNAASRGSPASEGSAQGAGQDVHHQRHRDAGGDQQRRERRRPRRGPGRPIPSRRQRPACTGLDRRADGRRGGDPAQPGLALGPAGGSRASPRVSTWPRTTTVRGARAARSSDPGAGHDEGQQRPGARGSRPRRRRGRPRTQRGPGGPGGEERQQRVRAAVAAAHEGTPRRAVPVRPAPASRPSRSHERAGPPRVDTRRPATPARRAGGRVGLRRLGRIARVSGRPTSGRRPAPARAVSGRRAACVRASDGRRRSTSPRTATSRPVGWPSPSQPVSARNRSLGATTASDSSSGAASVVDRAVLVPAAPSAPSAVTSRTRKPRWVRCSAIEAASMTACSKEDAGPVPRCAWSPVVEEEGGARLPRLLLAADHQLAGVCAGAPVHAAQVVAAAVLPHGHVLGAAAGEVARAVVARTGPRPRQRDGRERLRRGG